MGFADQTYRLPQVMPSSCSPPFRAMLCCYEMVFGKVRGTLQLVFDSHRYAGVQRKVHSRQPPDKLINKLLCHICSSSLSNTVIGVQRVFGCERYGILCSANQRTLSEGV